MTDGDDAMLGKLHKETATIHRWSLDPMELEKMLLDAMRARFPDVAGYDSARVEFHRAVSGETSVVIEVQAMHRKAQ